MPKNSSVEEPKVLGETPPLSDKFSFEIEDNGKLYLVRLQGEFEGREISLFPNFIERQASSNLFKNNSCEFLINGGFYNEKNNPIGLFVSDNKQISEFRINQLFNGIFSINDFDTPRITRDVPQDRLKIALQTGPLLVENSQNIILNSESQNRGRRMILGVTGENKVIFITIYEKNSVFDGPQLRELTRFLDRFEEESGIELADAINLDGGTASAFITPEFSLSELSPMGSFFCI